MRKYFGTDGIRRIANTELTPELVYKVAKAGAYVLSKHTDSTPTILIGRDTRISGSLIESAMTAGFLSYGANVISLGVIPTPAVAYLTKKLKAAAGVVISASHNTYEFNGVKYFSNLGMKISDELEEEIEEIMENEESLVSLSAANSKIGIATIRSDLEDQYVRFFEKTFADNIRDNENIDFKVAVDVANGATYKVAEKVFEKLGVNYQIINNTPNGININDNCGSTHMEALSKYVLENGMSLGIAYDGDGDRCLAVDERGNIIDGDVIMAIISNYLKSRNMLKKDTLVATVMSNLGLSKFTKENNMDFKQTKVGDRYVLEEMMKGGYNLGGEQSGHIIFLDYNPTGDGILTSLMLIQVILESGKKVSELAKIMKVYPQVLINAKVSNDKKELYKTDIELQNEIKKLENEFSSNGRVLIRPSGTEPLVRVMIEGEDIENITKKAKSLAEIIENKCK